MQNKRNCAEALTKTRSSHEIINADIKFLPKIPETRTETATILLPKYTKRVRAL